MTNEQAPLKTCPVPTPQPFASLVRRAGAFLIDGALLYLVAYMLNKYARDGLLTLNPWLPWLGNLAALTYFTAANGPVGKGRTLGKSIMSIVVTDAKGQPLDWVTSLRRTVPQQVVFLVAANPGLYCIVFPPSMRTGAGFLMTLVMVAALMFVITLVFSISLHPHKRGWHDIWGGSYVTSDPPPQIFHAALASPLDPIGERRMAHYWKITLALFAITSLAMMFRPIATMRSVEAQSIRQELTELQTDYPLEPYFLAAIQHPDPKMHKIFLDQVRAQRQNAIANGKEAPTTDSLSTIMINDGEAAIVQCLRVNGPFSTSDLENPILQVNVEGIRQTLWQNWPQWRDERKKNVASRLASTKKEKDRQQLQDLADLAIQTDYKTFIVLLFEPLQLLIYNDTEPKGIIRGPADPDEGPLVYETFDAARMQLPVTTPAAESANGTGAQPTGEASQTPEAEAAQ